MAAGAALAQGLPFAVTKINIPGSAGTHPYGINNDGTVVGTYRTANGLLRGFKWINRTFTDVVFPGATHTYALGINDEGAIVGSHSFNGPNGPWHSFVLVDGQFTEFDPPGWESDARDINNNGDIAGVYNESGNLPTHGFVRRADGTYVTIDLPGAPYSLLKGINDAGTVSGAYIDNSGRYHAYFSTGVQTVGFDFPGSHMTYGTDVNNLGVLLGTKQQAGIEQGYLLSGTSFRAFSVSLDGATLTRAWGINDNGHVVGNYVAPLCPQGCGFLAVPQPGVGTCQQSVTGSYASQTLTARFTLTTTATTQWDVYIVVGNSASRLWSTALAPVNTPVTVPMPGFPPLGKVSLYSILSTSAKGVMCADFTTVDTGSQN
jgi:probable HAF family extracellular repeat protein